jgi:membrane-associated protease RseP (regulator of RpoE activity)
MRKLAELADIVARGGHRVVTHSDKPEGDSGPNVKFGLDAGGQWIEVNGKKMSDDEVRTLMADLFNALFQVGCFAFEHEHRMGRFGSSDNG